VKKTKQEVCRRCQQAHRRAQGSEQEVHYLPVDDDGVVHVDAGRHSHHTHCNIRHRWVLGRGADSVTCLQCLTSSPSDGPGQSWRCSPRIWEPHPVDKRRHRMVLPPRKMEPGALGPPRRRLVGGVGRQDRRVGLLGALGGFVLPDGRLLRVPGPRHLLLLQKRVPVLHG
jgi:hypothetical protein